MKSIANEMTCRRARPRKGEVQIHLRRLGSHFHRIGWLNLATLENRSLKHPKQRERSIPIKVTKCTLQNCRNAPHTTITIAKTKEQTTNFRATVSTIAAIYFLAIHHYYYY